MRIRLTDLAVRKLPHPSKGQVRVWDEAQPGFGVLIGTRTKSYILMWGKERRIHTIGRVGEISLRDARNEARRLSTHEPPKKRSQRLSALVNAYLQDCEQRLRPTSVQRYADVLQNAPDIPLEKVTRNLAKTPHEIKAYKALFNWAIREELYDKNPFQHVRATYGKRERVLNEEELQKIWHYDHKPFTDYLKLYILTGQRKNQFSNFQIRNDTIYFPPEVMKGAEPHTIPLTVLVEKYITNLKPFYGWSKAKTRIDEKIPIPHWTIHDLRRTFATFHAKLGTPIHVVEALLAHRSGVISGVTAIYIKHRFLEEAREAQERYEAYLANHLNLT